MGMCVKKEEERGWVGGGGLVGSGVLHGTRTIINGLFRRDIALPKRSIETECAEPTLHNSRLVV